MINPLKSKTEMTGRYDRNRDYDGEILMARFTEQDILDKKFGGRKSKAKILISKPGGLDKLIPPSEITK